MNKQRTFAFFIFIFLCQPEPFRSGKCKEDYDVNNVSVESQILGSFNKNKINGRCFSSDANNLRIMTSTLNLEILFLVFT